MDTFSCNTKLYDTFHNATYHVSNNCLVAFPKVEKHGVEVLVINFPRYLAHKFSFLARTARRIGVGEL